MVLAVATLLAVAYGTRREEAAALGRSPARLRGSRTRAVPEISGNGPSVTPDILGLAEAEAVEAGRAGEPTVVNHLNPQGMSGFREHRGTGHKRRHTSGTQVELRVSVNKRGIIPRN